MDDFGTLELAMNSTLLAILLAVGLFAVLMLLMETGRRFGVRRLAKTS